VHGEHRRLSRGTKEATGNPGIEAGWRSISVAASGLANTFSRMFDKSSSKQAFDDLGDALDTLDIAHRALPQEAGMPPLIETTPELTPRLVHANA